MGAQLWEGETNFLTPFLALVIYSTLKMEAKCSSKSSVYKDLTWRHIPEDGILVTSSLGYRFVA
jgi:hypothetical protein